ncbi:branched-chain amino acid transport system ATP-binding protein [Pseudochelatococcus lubricantis]|uniref:Branched-chain amino acid transport system ATP-binding protein n=1 Tax=Pseudochelatococcus lubricantis TaxID=1538102 RepID=A0ABX0UYR0_9HYPH|nr:ABC transporter ATP-binding protein [Pseudochelatococcus lubricantis]NIJ56725.1 branched-chain amino acid transport system ATP-binding protein [Pseudochelatococcus lubricantis]
MTTQTLQTLEARDVHISFGGIRALSGVNMKLRRGVVFGLIGPNGAGKTTMVNVLSGFQRPTSGTVNLDGADASGIGPQKMARAGIGRSFQAARLFRDMTVEQNLMVAAFGAGLPAARAARAAHEILEWMGLAAAAGKRCDTLSYGDERRVSIARALALDPAFVLLDEPASGMNDAECDALMHTIAHLPARFGCGVLLIEHNMKVIMGVCDRVHVLDGGRSLAEGTPVEVQNDPTVRRAYLGEKAAPKSAALF